MTGRLAAKVGIAWDAVRKNLLSSSELFFVSEWQDWVIKEESRNLCRHLESSGLVQADIVYSTKFLNAKALHYMSVNTLWSGKRWKTHRGTTKKILTWFHLEDSDKRLKAVQDLPMAVDVIHTACSSTASGLIDAGLPREMLRILPMGVDEKAFRRLPEEDRRKLRRKFGIPESAFVIGSFQKDGVGWGEGEEPKLIKGPDIFCESMRRIHGEIPIHVLLSGPARGYVKKNLQHYGIPYTHVYMKRHADLADLYNCLDAYVIASRIEGGPKSLLESMACGVPLVSTPVGMVADLPSGGREILVTKGWDAAEIADKVLQIASDDALRAELSTKAREAASRFSYKVVARKYFEELYKPLMES